MKNNLSGIIIHLDPKSTESLQTSMKSYNHIANAALNQKHENVNDKDEPHVYKRVRRASNQSEMVCYLHIRVRIEDIYRNTSI